MKLSKTQLVIIISSLALLAVILIQVNWILRSARMKEQLFNEKVTMVLTKTAEALSADTSALTGRGVYVDEIGKQKTDSLLKYYMSLYHIQIDYTFNVVPRVAFSNPVDRFKPITQNNNEYQACIQDVPNGKQGFELKLSFPEKNQYIMAEMGLPFITSVLLIIIVLILSWRTILSLQKEKKISQHTTEFLNNMTHEFKTPLTNIALAGKMMTKESNIGDKDKIGHYSGIILDENEKLRLQVEQVLSITALERGEVPLVKTTVDIHQLIKDAIRHMSIQVEYAHGKITQNLQAAHFELEVDRTHLMNALYNLIDNAVKYSAQAPEIKIETFNENNYFVMLVEDNGPGIDKSYHQKIFEKYFRIPTGNIHDVKGFGLGLAYVKQIIQLHGGFITMESEQGKGTRFKIQLPNE